MSDLQQLWKMLDETGAASMKVVLDAHGIPRSKAMILVSGVQEVEEVLAAVQKVEETWEGADAE